MDRRRRGWSPSRTGGSSFHERGSARLPIDDSTELRHRYTIEIRVRDVSTRGFMAECVEAVAIGSHVSLDIPGIGDVRAQVRWQIGTKMGGMFLDPISLEQCEWVAEQTAPGPLEAA